MVEQFQVTQNNIAEVREAAAQHAPSNAPPPTIPTAKVTGETSRVVFKNGQATQSSLSQSSTRSSGEAPLDSLGDLAGKPVVARNDLGRQLTGSEIKGDSQ